MTGVDPHGVTTGFRAEIHCWKCFKENDVLTLMDGKPMNLCKGCLYVVKQLSQWLNAYGLGIRVTQYSLDDVNGHHPPEEGKNGVEEGVEGGETDSPHSKIPNKAVSQRQ